MSKLMVAIGTILAITVGFFISGESLAGGNIQVNGSAEKGQTVWENEQITLDGTLVNFGGMTEQEILEQIKMSPEDEAKIVHEVPPCPVIIDGVKYEPEQIHLFDGQQLGFITGKDGRLYAFTTEEGIHQFMKDQNYPTTSVNETSSVATTDTMSHFYVDALYAGGKLDLVYYASFSYLSSAWDNVISSMQISGSCIYCRLYDYPSFQGDYHQASAGAGQPWLTWFGWNDRASSILHVN